MSTSLVSTGVQFPDGSVQTVAAGGASDAVSSGFFFEGYGAGSHTVTVPANANKAFITAAGAGGAGSKGGYSNNNAGGGGGGGGAGAFLDKVEFAVNSGTITVNLGSGGNVQTGNSYAANAGNSTNITGGGIASSTLGGGGAGGIGLNAGSNNYGVGGNAGAGGTTNAAGGQTGAAGQSGNQGHNQGGNAGSGGNQGDIGYLGSSARNGDVNDRSADGAGLGAGGAGGYHNGSQQPQNSKSYGGEGGDGFYKIVFSES